MSTQEREKVNFLSARFVSAATEAAYQSFVFKRNLTSNVWGVCIGLALIAIYIFAEFIDSANPSESIAVRGAIFMSSLILLMLLFDKRLVHRQELIITAILILMGVATNINIWRQPSLDNTFYIGIIQGYIMFSLLLRLGFGSVLFVIAVTQLEFVAVVFSKGDFQNAALQSANTFVVGLICVAGVYLLQRYQRVDFLKGQTITKQNAQLNVLLADVKLDNERKVAAMNMLVHFVKTPLHQINGFSDIVMTNLTGNKDQRSIEQSVEGAAYIKEATADLTKSVNKLLTYHRLDDAEGQHAEEALSLDASIEDFGDLLNVDIEFTAEGQAGEVHTDKHVLQTAFRCLAEHYSSEKTGVSNLTASLDAARGVTTVALRDNGVAIARDDFLERTKPLTKLDKYLTCSGSEMPMMLRTVARAIEICGGAFTHEAHDDGNLFVITLRDRGSTVVELKAAG